MSPKSITSEKNNLVTEKFRKMINKILERFEYAGTNPYTRTQTKVLFIRSILFGNFCTIILESFYLTNTKYVDVSTAIYDLVGYLALIQVTNKSLVSHTKHITIKSLTDKILKLFWISEKELTEEQRKEIQVIFKVTNVVSKCYLASICITLYGYIICAPFKNSLVHSIILPSNLLENPYVYWFLYAVQTLLFSFTSMTGLMMMDVLFLVGIASGIVQLKLINYKLLTIGSNGYNPLDYQTVIKCVEHHNLLFVFFSQIEEIFSTVILNMLGTNTLLGVILLFVFLVETNIFRILTFVFIMISVAGQFYMYCLLGQIIQNETSEVAEAAYGSMWERTPDLKVRNALRLIIQRSHKNVSITMGNFLILSLENFTRVTKMMFSILTLLVNMKSKEN